MLQSPSNRGNLKVLILVGIMLMIVTLGLREIANRPSPISDYPSGISESSVLVVVKSGQSGEEIARELDRLDVISSWQAFFRLAIVDSRSERIAPGSHRIDRKIPAAEALEQLLDPRRIEGLISLRDGVRLREVEAILKSLGYEGVDRALRGVSPPKGFNFRSLEGFLYPARYSFEPGSSTQTVVAAMVRRFESAIADFDFNNGQTKYTPDQILIIASLVEAEGTPDVFSKVARVIYNRLERGIPLQLDSTIHYIQGSRGEISLSLEETKVKSRYNTYLNRGLPPGPIGSPTRAALLAALEPAAGDWTYFITVAPGQTRFTASYDEFLEWKRLYRQNYSKGLFDD